MQLVERHIIVDCFELEEICSKSKRLYNQALYYLRQSSFGKIERFSENELTGLMAEFNHEDYRSLPAQTAQQVVKKCFKNWKSFWKGFRSFKKNKSKFKGKPKMPSYKKEQFLTVFTSQQIRIKDPYGKNGAKICFDCGMKPENEQTTNRMFDNVLNGKSELPTEIQSN